MDQAELDRVLQQHQLWVVSKGDEGACANLQYTDLQHTDHRGACLVGVKLRGADLQSVVLWGADLRGADLQSAVLWGADLEGVDLRDANLRDADLRNADLRHADLRGAKFSINIRSCWRFCNAKFTADALPWLILHPQWTKWKDTVQIEEA